MPEIQTSIREWLLTQQDWLQEAADRLIKQGELNQSDLKAISALLKTPEGQSATKHREFGHLVDTQNTDSELRLSSISEICGIENLSPRQPLSFGKGNLTVIYGHNGSGKSSYTRIIKNASGNPRAKKLKPNVFKVIPTESKCQIEFQLDGQLNSVQWYSNSSPIEVIRSIDIFDSDEASHYLSKESSSSYTPPVVSFFEALVKVCGKIKEILQNEQDLLHSILPTIPINYRATEPGRRYLALNADMSSVEMHHLLTWTKQEQHQLDALSERLKVDDPSMLARQKRSTKIQTEQIITSINEGMSAYSIGRLQTIRGLRKLAIEKRKIAEEAVHIGSAKLEGVGTGTWLALWEAARNYSQSAYPGLEFPVTKEARCILCHQELDEDAQQRLHNFETFVQGQLETEAKAAEATYQAALKVLLIPLEQQQIYTQCEAAGLTDLTWKQYLWRFWAALQQSRVQLLSGEMEGIASQSPDASKAIEALSTYCHQLESFALQSDKDAQDFDRGKALQEKQDLEAKRWIAQQELSVRNEITRLQQMKAYEGWKYLTNPRKISVKAGSISEQVITKAYVSRFNNELQLLGATRLKVELVKTRINLGKTLHKLQLKGTQNNQVMPDSVLSEGERRIISLAAFLADVADKPQTSPFIFDDPISSLDHDFEWSVACRLIELAKKRQVLVFTHRLSLYGAMEDVAKKVGGEWKKQHHTALCIEAYGDAVGHPVDQATWNANTKKANNILLNRLDTAKRAGEEDGSESYRALAQGICSDFRKLLERSVEDDLLNEVVKRHRRSITTDNRLTALHNITTEDCRFIDDLMTKYSCYEHSQSQEDPILTPEEHELRVDIESLKNWRENFSKRYNP